MVCLGFETWTAGWKAQTKPRRSGCHPILGLFLFSSFSSIELVNLLFKWPKCVIIDCPVLDYDTTGGMLQHVPARENV